MKALRSKIMAGEFDLVNTKVMYCGEGTWFLQEFNQNNRSTGSTSVYRQEFDVTPDDNSFDSYFISCYSPYTIAPARNLNISKDKFCTRLRTDVVKSITCTRSGNVQLELENGSKASIRLLSGEYLLLTPRV